MDEIFTGIAVGIGEYFIERDARRNEQLVKNNWRDKKGKLRGPYNSYGRLLLSINIGMLPLAAFTLFGGVLLLFAKPVDLVASLSLIGVGLLLVLIAWFGIHRAKVYRTSVLQSLQGKAEDS